MLKMEQNKSESVTKKAIFWGKLLSLEGILLGLITALGYICAFCYEKGYCDFFNIPHDFISISISSIIVAISAVSIILAGLFFTIEFLMLTEAGRKTAVGRRIRILMYPTLPVIFCIFLGVSWKLWILFVPLLIFFTLIEFGYPLLTQRHVKGFINKLVAQDIHELKHPKPTLTTKIASTVGERGIVLIITLIWLPFVSSSIGTRDARQETQFTVINVKNSPTKLVVLRLYSNKLVCAPLDINNKKVTRELHILNLDSQEIILEKVKIGPLDLAESESYPPMKKTDSGRK